nr:hypothetical protein [Tanacetum cinerariifolium]
MCCELEGNAATRGGSFNYTGGVYGPYEGCEGSYLAKGTLEDLGVELNTVVVPGRKLQHCLELLNVGIEVLEEKTVNVLKVGTEHNAADALTKVVLGRKLQHYLELLNVGIG